MGVTVPMEVVSGVCGATRVPVLAIERGQWREPREVLARSRPPAPMPPFCPLAWCGSLFHIWKRLKGTQKHISRDRTAKMKPTTNHRTHIGGVF